MLFRPARASDLDAICELLATPRRGPEAVRAVFTSDPAFEPDQVRVAWTGGRIVACARIYPRQLRIGTTVVTARGIGDLRTESRHQGRGLATSLLAECISAMRLEGAVLAPLFAPRRRQALFVRQGWSVLPAPGLDVPAGALAPPAPVAAGGADSGAAGGAGTGRRGRVIRLPQEILVRPLEGDDLDAVLALHESVNVARTGSAVRDRATWLGSLAALDAQGARMFVAEQGGELAGYVAARPCRPADYSDGPAPAGDAGGRRVSDRRVEVLELLLAPWSQDAWRPLLRAALDMVAGAAALRAVLPRDYRALLQDALGDAIPDADGDGAAVGGADVATAPERDDLLVRVVDPARLLREIAPLLAARLRTGPAPDPLRLRIGHLRGGVALSIADGRVAVDTPARDDPHALPESLFLALLFGVEGAHARLRALADDGPPPLIPLPAPAQETLERLFPPQDWIYWRSDAF